MEFFCPDQIEYLKNVHDDVLVIVYFSVQNAI